MTNFKIQYLEQISKNNEKLIKISSILKYVLKK